MRQALECCHRGWGRASSSASRRRPGDQPRGRSSSSPGACGKARPSAARAGRTDVPKIVDWYMDGKIDIDDDHAHCRSSEINTPST
jgi:S-(hydroxymethyl)glutathione dehydrogenase/alcohol dehydrogenase